MARVTIVGVAVAEPQSDRAAKLALEVDVFGAVLFAIFNTRSHAHRGAFRTNELICLELFKLTLLVLLIAVFHAAEVGLFTLEAHIVGTLVHSILF